MQEKTLLNQANSTSNIHSGEVGSVSYDIFGSPYQKTGSFLVTDSLDFGYLGKPYNATTELYDYGFRDYSPEVARFTTVDPIRDGRNWYSYVVNDPVNYVDLWGLECKSESDRKDKDINTKQNIYYFLKIEGFADFLGNNYFDSFQFIYSSDKGKMQGAYIKEYSSASFEKKMNTVNSEIEDSVKFQSDSGVFESIILTDIKQGSFILPGDSSVKKLEKIELPSQADTTYLIESVNYYLNTTLQDNTGESK